MKNSKKLRLFSGIVAAAMLMSGGVNASAQAAPGVDATAVSSAKKDFAGAYSAEAALQLLVAGIGPLAESNPRLLNLLGFAEERPAPDLGLVNRLVDDFQVYYPEFSSQVLPKLQSGKPRSVEGGLKIFTEKFISYLEVRKAEANKKLNPDGNSPVAEGCGVTWVCGAVTAVVVANGALYATVAVATFVVVAGGAVVVLLVVPGYLADKDYMTATNSDQIGRETAISELTKVLSRKA